MRGDIRSMKEKREEGVEEVTRARKSSRKGTRFEERIKILERNLKVNQRMS